MKHSNLQDPTTINEIRTERLSKALQKMRKKSISVCAMRDNEKSQMNIPTIIPESPRRKASIITETLAGFRRRTSSVPVIREIRVDDHGAELKTPVSRQPSGLAVCTNLNRFVRHLIARQKKGNQATTMAAKKANSKLQQQMSLQPVTVTGARLLNAPVGPANRCPSPVRFSTMLSFPTSCSEPVSPRGSLSPMVQTNTVLVIGSEGVGKGDLIESSMQSENKKLADKRELGFSADGNILTLSVDNEEMRLRFIEVNNQKNDLWLSLTAALYIVMYNYDDCHSFRNAVSVVRKVRECNDSKAVVLVCNKQACDGKRTNGNGDDGRHIARQNNCKFMEFPVTADPSRDTEELLVRVAHQLRRQLAPRPSTRREQSLDANLLCADTTSFDQGWFHLRTYSSGSNSSTGSKSSSAPTPNPARHKFWNKKKGKSEADGKLGNSCADLALSSGVQKYLNLGKRRGSLSLENLPSND